MPTGMGLGLGLGMNRAPPQGKKASSDILCEAISKKVRVTATYEGENFTLEPYVVYDLGDPAVTYVDARIVSTYAPPGNRPPALAPIEVSALSKIALTSDAFVVHPRLKSLLARYEGVKCIIDAG
ncbi:hypothetical protein [Hwanghaeella sp.]|uniref:hypothetical protein n=1 Tax=Hwanghaeella sp. TaxID=2605943 RepID=UPI003CCC1E00